MKEDTPTPTDGGVADAPTSGGCVLQAAHPSPDIKFFQSVALRDWKRVRTTATADTITAAIQSYVYLRNLVDFTTHINTLIQSTFFLKELDCLNALYPNINLSIMGTLYGYRDATLFSYHASVSQTFFQPRTLNFL
jgi:hypothetical protein